MKEIIKTKSGLVLGTILKEGNEYFILIGKNKLNATSYNDAFDFLTIHKSYMPEYLKCEMIELRISKRLNKLSKFN